MALLFEALSRWKKALKLKRQRNRLIKQLIGTDQNKWETAKTLLNLGWIPEDIVEKVWFLAASGNWEGVLKLGSPAVQPVLSILLDGNIEMHTRKASAEVLDQLGWKPQDRQELIAYLLVSERWNELVKVGLEVTDVLLMTCKSEPAGSRWRFGAMKALGEIKAIEAVGLLTGILHEKHVAWDHAGAAEALLSIGDSSAIDALSDAFKRTGGQVYTGGDHFSHYAAVRDACANALAMLDGEKAISRVCDIICECANFVNSCGAPRIDDNCSLHFGMGLGDAYVAEKGIEVLEKIGGHPIFPLSRENCP